MNEKDIYSGIAAALVEKPKYEFTINIEAQVIPNRLGDFGRWIDKIRGKATIIPAHSKTLTIMPCKVGNIHRVAGMAVLLPDQFLSGDYLEEDVLPLLVPHSETMVYIIASAIQNDCQDPKAELLAFIRKHFDMIDLYNGLQASLSSQEMQAFINSIVLVKGTELILKPKASPTDGSELIASLTAQSVQSARTLAGQ